MTSKPTAAVLALLWWLLAATQWLSAAEPDETPSPAMPWSTAMGALHSPAGNAAYFAALHEREGVMVTPLGAVFEVLQPGDGPSPVLGSTVSVQYRGYLIDGTVFDTPAASASPISLALVSGQLISGWIEALPMMPVGSTYRFYLPPELGYGNHSLANIPANSILIFEIELLGFH